MGLFNEEDEILKINKILQTKKVDEKHFSELVTNYEHLLKQIKRLMKRSDKQENKQRKIEKRLKKYVSHQLYKNITKGKELAETYETTRKNLTIFFSDIKGFSLITAAMDGESLSIFLNSYLEQMTKIVIKHGGTLDKYIGDAIMVFFGAPGESKPEENVKRCLAMSLEMREKMKEIRREWYEMGYEQPFHIRMGIANGFCMVGNFGSSQRMDYTVTGRTVNLAARLEQCAEVDEILLCHSTWGIAKKYINCNPPEEKILKGSYEPKITHQLVCFKDATDSSIVKILDSGVQISIDKSKTSKEKLLELVDEIFSPSDY